MWLILTLKVYHLRQALRQAFVVFCNMGVSGISNAEIFSTFFDNYLTENCNEMIDGEAFEDTLRKVHILLYSPL